MHARGRLSRATLPRAAGLPRGRGRRQRTITTQQVFDVVRERDVRRHIGLVEAPKASAGAELVAAQSGKVAAAAQERDALVATGMMPAGVRP